MFIILVAADLFSVKTNFELQFVSPPTMIEFQAKVEAVLATEASLRRPLDVPMEPFSVQKMQIFDDVVEQWVDLTSQIQLKGYSQVYVLQRETAFHREIQSKIPPPCKTIPALTMSPTMPPPPPPYMSPSPVDPIPPPQVQSSLSPVITSAVRGESHQDKVRQVFNIMDENRVGSFVEQVFVDNLLKYRVEFDTVSVPGELFHKADSNNDEKIDFGEFQRFAELYPTILDSLFYRWKDQVAEDKLSASIVAAGKAVDASHEKLRTSNDVLNSASNEVINNEANLEAAIGTLEGTQTSETEAKAVLEQAQEETSQVRQSVSSKVQEAAHGREDIRKAEVSHALATRDLDAAVQSLQQQQDERNRTLQRIEELQNLLSSQELEVATRENGVSTSEEKKHISQADLDACNERSRLIANELTVAEGELARVQDIQREKGVAHLQSKDAVARAAVKKEGAVRDLLAAKDNESAKKIIVSNTEREVMSSEEFAANLRQECDEHIAKRRSAEEEERPLLGEEVRLRFQRETLEKEEANLRSSHRTFHSGHNRSGVPSASPARALSHSPQPLSPSSPFDTPTKLH